MREPRQVHVLFAKMAAALQAGPVSVRQLAELTEFSPSSVNRYLSALRMVGAAYVCGWGRNSVGENCVPLYRMGKGKDVERKPDAKNAAHCRAYRQRQIEIRRLAAETVATAKAGAAMGSVFTVGGV